MVSKFLHGQGVCYRFGEAFQVFKLGEVNSDAFWMGGGENASLTTVRSDFKK